MKKHTHFRPVRKLGLLLSVILTVSVFTVPVLADAYPFSYGNIEEARLKALDCLMYCGFSVEYTSDPSGDTSHNLIRWTDTIRIYVGGYPTDEDQRQLDLFIAELATHCPNMPNVRRVPDPESANIVISYVPLAEMGSYVEGYVPDNWGFAYWWYDGNYSLYKSQIAIASDVNTTESKNHLLREELVGAFGLTNDHYTYSDSIVYQEWTTTQQLSDVDWLMLNMLYDPDLRPGMSSSEAYDILLAKIYR